VRFRKSPFFSRESDPKFVIGHEGTQKVIFCYFNIPRDGHGGSGRHYWPRRVKSWWLGMKWKWAKGKFHTYGSRRIIHNKVSSVSSDKHIPHFRVLNSVDIGDSVKTRANSVPYSGNTWREHLYITQTFMTRACLFSLLSSTCLLRWFARSHTSLSETPKFQCGNFILLGI